MSKKSVAVMNWKRAVVTAKTLHGTSVTSPRAVAPAARGRYSSMRQVTQEVLKMKREEKEREDKRSSQAMDTIRKLTDNYEQEKKTRQNAEQRVEQLQLEHDRTTALMDRSNKNNEKLREENKSKVDQMDKMRRDMNYLEDRLRSLEHRATEVANLEISVENLKKSLENSQQETRDAERDFRITRRALDENEKKLTETQKTADNLHIKMSDLKLQVKEEVIKNSRLEEQLEKMSRVREELTERDDRITQLEREIEEKTLVLQHCRKCLREEKEKASKMTEDCRANDQLVDDIQISQSESITLKKLLVAKDTLLVQKSQLLENIRNAVKNSLKSEDAGKVLRLIEGGQASSSLMATYPQGAKGKDPQFQRKAWGSQHQHRAQQSSHANGYAQHQGNMNGHSEADHANNNIQGQRPTRRTASHSAASRGSASSSNQFFRSVVETDQHYQDGLSESSSISEICLQERSRSTTAFVRPHPAKLYRDSFEDFRSLSPYGSEDGASSYGSVWTKRLSATSPRTVNALNSRGRTGPVSQTPNNHFTRSQSAKTPSQKRPGRNSRKSWSPEPRDSGGSSPRSVRRTQSMTSYPNVSRPVSKTSSVDRDKAVKRLVKIGDRVLINMGKREDGKVNTQGAVIKYLGSLDQTHSAINCYAGVKLDEPVGDNNGRHNGKQYFRVPMQYGKFIRLQKIVFIQDPATGTYKDVLSLKSQQNGDDLISNKRPV